MDSGEVVELIRLLGAHIDELKQKLKTDQDMTKAAAERCQGRIEGLRIAITEIQLMTREPA